jgi:hypothetical protein
VHAFAGALLLGVFGVGMGAFSNALAIASRKREWMFWAVQQSLLFPLLILSGMMLPLEAGPEWMQVVSRFNPLTYIVDAERALFSGTFADRSVPLAVVAALITCAVGLWVGVRQVPRARPERHCFRRFPSARRCRCPGLAGRRVSRRRQAFQPYAPPPPEPRRQPRRRPSWRAGRRRS